MRSTLVSILMWAAACGGGGGGNADAPPSVPATITVTGTAASRGLNGTTPVVGAVVVAHKGADDSIVTMATTDASGNYTLTITTNGVALDGYLKASFAGDVDTYLYPPAPLAADFAGASINMLTTGNFSLISTIAQGNQMTGKGVIAAEVLDATMKTVGGATVSSTPASNPYRYDDPSTGLPSSTATATFTDGIGYMFNAPAGAVTVSASLAGMTFKSHPLKAWADSLTTTLITP